MLVLVCQLLDIISAKIVIIKTQIGDLESQSANAHVYYKDYMSERAARHQSSLPKFEGNKYV